MNPTIQDLIDQLENTLRGVNLCKTGERNEEQRCIAILATQVEQALAWAHYTKAAMEQAGDAVNQLAGRQ